MLRVSCFLFLCVQSFVLVAQRKWINVDSLYQPLPSTVHVFFSNDSLDGKPFIAYYVSATLADKHLDFTTQIGKGKRYTPSQYYAMEDSALLVVNCTFFTFAENRNLNLVMKDGKMLAYNIPAIRAKGLDSNLFVYPIRSAIGIGKDRGADVGWIYTDTAKRWPYVFSGPADPKLSRGANSDPTVDDIQIKALEQPGIFQKKKRKWKMRTAVGGGPTLLKRGEVFVTNNEELLFAKGEQDKHPRTLMGYTRDGQLIIMAIQGRFPGLAEGATMQQEALLMKELGCWEALNLDGGGSSCLLINGKETIKPSDKEGQRPVPAVFLIKSAK
jgi:hypothetical protein